MSYKILVAKGSLREYVDPETFEVDDEGFREMFVRGRNFSLERNMSDRGRLTLTLMDDEGYYDVIRKGTVVRVVKEDTGEDVYFGYTLRSTRHGVDEFGRRLFDLKMVDHTYLLESKYIRTEHKGESIFNSIETILDSSGGENVTIGEVSITGNIKGIETRGLRITEFLNQLCEAEDGYWFVSVDRKLYVRKRGSVVNPYPLEESDVLSKPRDTLENEKYCSGVYFPDLSDKVRKTMKIEGNGETNEFDLRYPVGDMISIYRKATWEEEGIYQTFTTKEDKKENGTVADFYWEERDEILVMDPLNLQLMTGEYLEVVYDGLVQRADGYVYTDLEEFDEMKNWTGFIGRVDEIYEKGVIGELEANEIGQRIIDSYKQDIREIELETRREFEVGEKVTFNLTRLGITEDFEVKRITTFFDAKRELHTVTFVKGRVREDWARESKESYNTTRYSSSSGSTNKGSGGSKSNISGNFERRVVSAFEIRQDYPDVSRPGSVYIVEEGI